MQVAVSRFIPVAPLRSLLSHTRHTLHFHIPLASPPQTYRLLLFRLASSNAAPEFYSMEATCPHLGAELKEADVEDMVVTCPWHQYEFSLETGESSTGMRLCTYAVKVEGQGKDRMVLVESPGTADEQWELKSFEPVSEAFADMPSVADLAITPPPISGPDANIGAAAPALKKPASSSIFLAATGKTDTSKTTLTSETLPPLPPPTTLLTYALHILRTPNPLAKVALTREALAFLRARTAEGKGNQPLVTPEEAKWAASVVGDGTPPREEGKGGTLNPNRMGKRGKGGSEKSRGLMLHALANIEQWAIDLAWDVIARFAMTSIDGRTLPDEFYLDWAKVAEDEAKHFSLLVALLNARGIQYGDHAVHAGLWMSAQETSASLRSRLAIIHMVHEARGLDVNPVTIEKFRKQNDMEAVTALEIIHSDEVTHVTAGHKWFTWVCAAQNVEPVATFRREVQLNFRGKLKGPFNEVDRGMAGMTQEYYEDLEGWGGDQDAVRQQGGKPVESEGEMHPRLT